MPCASSTSRMRSATSRALSTPPIGAESREAEQWLDDWVPRFKTEEPEGILAALRALPTPTQEAAIAKGRALRYLGSRKEQIRYATFREQGLPIGSGMVESAGKLVVEARLKGSGMHWAPRHLNPLLTLRSRLCSGQWDEVWPRIHQDWRAAIRRQQRTLRRQRQAARAAQQPSPPPPEIPHRQSVAKTIIDGRPTSIIPGRATLASSPHDSPNNLRHTLPLDLCISIG